MSRQTKDLFEESTMSFGEHLEELRTRLIRALLWLAIGVSVCLFNGGIVVDFVRKPIDDALRRYSKANIQDDTAAIKSWSDKMYDEWGLDIILGERKKPASGEEEVVPEVESKLPAGTLKVNVPVDSLRRALHQVNPDAFGEPLPAAQVPEPAPTEPGDAPSPKAAPQTVPLIISSPELAEMQAVVEQSRRAVTLKVEEAFMTYLKVSTIAGFLLASPFIFRELWMFLAAGLYPHERRYVYVYGFISLILFFVGAVFCFYAVFPFVLKFLLGFNAFLKIQPQIRLSEWINFAVMLPVMFGISFQLPLVMLFLERMQILQVETYSQQRKMSILVISIISMFLTPADPMSMILMMVPLIGLYELGILMCKWSPPVSPFEGAAES